MGGSNEDCSLRSLQSVSGEEMGEDPRDPSSSSDVSFVAIRCNAASDLSQVLLGRSGLRLPGAGCTAAPLGCAVALQDVRRPKELLSIDVRRRRAPTTFPTAPPIDGRRKRLAWPRIYAVASSRLGLYKRGNTAVFILYSRNSRRKTCAKRVRKFL